MVAQIDGLFRSLSKKKTFTRYLSYAFYEGRPLTTKGRWINPLVFFLYRLQEILPTAKKVDKPIFILGTGRSGTTILGVTLGIHQSVGFLNEPKAFWSYLHQNEDLIGSYNENSAFYRLNVSDVTPSMKKKAHRVYGNYLRYSLSDIVVDKYPELIFRVDFVREIFPDARFLFLYRDGYDTCHSIRHWSERLGVEQDGSTHDWWGLNDRKWHLLCEQIVRNDKALAPFADEIAKFDNHEHRAAVEWIVTMKEGLDLLSKYPNFVKGVKYEDFVADADFREQILHFCGLESDPNFSSYCQQVLKSPKAQSPIDLPACIKAEFFDVMRRLGYEPQ